MHKILPRTLAALTPQLEALDQQFTQTAVARPDALSPAGGGASTDCLAPSITATFIKAAGILTLSGNGGANVIDVSRNAAGALLVNDGHVPIAGGTPTVANVSQIQVVGQAGNDIITLNEVNGALPRANLFGGNGDDILTGGSGADRLFGQNDHDTLFGKGGNDQLFGGNGNDVLSGGTGNDQMFGEAGNDRMLWNPGEGTDLMEGGDGIDTAEVNGGNGAEAFTLTANGTRVRFDRIDPAPFSLDIGTTENLVLNMGGGNDTFSATGNLAPLIKLTVDGGGGDDTILGSNGNDTLRGGDGNDFIDGQQGNDTANLGAGDDIFQWDPGDGSDVIDGGAGSDLMLFNGSNAAEDIDISANGDHARFFRNVASITMDTDNLERIDFNALGGADRITVGDLSGTDVTEVNLNLAATGGAGDAEPDSVTVNATNADDNIIVFGDNTGGVTVFGLAALVNIAGAEGANDALTINGQDGDDIIDASAVQPGTIQLHLNGGNGDDIIIGSAGDDVIDGGAGDDILFGGAGNDVISGGGGGDIIFQDFTLGADRIDVSGRGLSFDWLTAHTSDVDGNAVLDLGDQHITLTGVSAAALHQEDFLV